MINTLQHSHHASNKRPKLSLGYDFGQINECYNK